MSVQLGKNMPRSTVGLPRTVAIGHMSIPMTPQEAVAGREARVVEKKRSTTREKRISGLPCLTDSLKTEDVQKANDLHHIPECVLVCDTQGV